MTFHLMILSEQDMVIKRSAISTPSQVWNSKLFLLNMSCISIFKVETNSLVYSNHLNTKHPKSEISTFHNFFYLIIFPFLRVFSAFWYLGLVLTNQGRLPRKSEGFVASTFVDLLLQTGTGALSLIPLEIGTKCRHSKTEPLGIQNKIAAILFRFPIVQF